MEKQENKMSPQYSIAPILQDLLWVLTSKQPCWRWWESGIAGWERSQICSGCGWTSSSGKGSPQGSLPWRGSGDEQSGSCWWPCAAGCPPALGTSAPGSAPGGKTNGMWARTGRGFPNSFSCQLRVINSRSAYGVNPINCSSTPTETAPMVYTKSQDLVGKDVNAQPVPPSAKGTPSPIPGCSKYRPTWNISRDGAPTDSLENSARAPQSSLSKGFMALNYFSLFLNLLVHCTE